MSRQAYIQHFEAERSAATTDLNTLAPHESLVRFYDRLDQTIQVSTQLSTIKPVCREGCAYCCYYKVEAKAIEILAIQHYAKSRLSTAQMTRIIEQAQHNIEQTQHLSYTQQLMTNQRCAFLLEQRCTIYPVRPSKCRNFHATEVEGCKKSVEEPEADVPNSIVPLIHASAHGVSDGFEQTVAAAGKDARVYDLNSAFLEAIHNPAVAKRFASGKKTFLSATVIEHP